MAHSVNKHGDGSHSLLIFPLGHPVELAGSDANLLKTALRRWPAPERRFDVEPLRFSVLPANAACGNAVDFQPHPEGFLLNHESGQAEFTLSSRSGSISTPALLEPLVLTALDWTFFIGIHAACVTRNGRSLLLCGDSHAGKSTLAYACARSGWSFVSDNAVHWSAAPWDVLVTGSPALRLREGAQAMFGLARADVVPADEGLASSLTAPAGKLVFLNRRPGPSSIRTASVNCALEYLAAYDTRPDRQYAEGRYRALLREGTCTLDYEDVWDGVRCLETLL